MTGESKLPTYMPYPRFMLMTDFTQIARLLYSLLLDRATLSQKNGMADEQGRLYVIFPIENLSTAIDRSHMTVKNALNELETAGLIERKRQGFSAPNRIYVKLPDEQEIVQLTDRKLSLIGQENCLNDGQKTLLMTDRKLSPNNLSINNKKNNDMNRAREAPAAYGQYGNVFLTEQEYAELKQEVPGIDKLIDELSSYMKSKGTAYADHAATLRRWFQREKPKQGIPDYSYKEGESL